MTPAYLLPPPPNHPTIETSRSPPHPAGIDANKYLEDNCPASNWESYIEFVNQVRALRARSVTPAATAILVRRLCPSLS